MYARARTRGLGCPRVVMGERARTGREGERARGRRSQFLGHTLSPVILRFFFCCRGHRGWPRTTPRLPRVRACARPLVTNADRPSGRAGRRRRTARHFQGQQSRHWGRRRRWRRRRRPAPGRRPQRLGTLLLPIPGLPAVLCRAVVRAEWWRKAGSGAGRGGARVAAPRAKKCGVRAAAAPFFVPSGPVRGEQAAGPRPHALLTSLACLTHALPPPPSQAAESALPRPAGRPRLGQGARARVRAPVVPQVRPRTAGWPPPRRLLCGAVGAPAGGEKVQAGESKWRSGHGRKRWRGDRLPFSLAGATSACSSLPHALFKLTFRAAGNAPARAKQPASPLSPPPRRGGCGQGRAG